MRARSSFLIAACGAVLLVTACGAEPVAPADEPTATLTPTQAQPTATAPLTIDPTAVFRDAVATAVAENEETNRFEVVRELAIEGPNAREQAIYDKHSIAMFDHADTLAALVLGWNLARGHTCCSPLYVDFSDIMDRWAINRERFELKVITGQLQNNGAPLDARLRISLFDSKGGHILSFGHTLEDWKRDEKRYFRIVVPIVPELWSNIASAKLVEIDG